MKILGLNIERDSARKNISIAYLDEFLQWTMTQKLGGRGSIRELRRAVPWLFRSVEMISQSIADFPFEIQNEAGEVIDSSDDWQNKLEFTKDFKPLLKKVSASCQLRGGAYVYPARNRIMVKELRYWVFDSVQPVLTEQNGLEKFERNSGAQISYFAPDELVYFWLPDSDVEIGAPLAYPAQAAFNAAGVLLSLDEFFHETTQNGLLKSFIAAVKGLPPTSSERGKAEKERVEEDLNRQLLGKKNQGKLRVVNADTVDIVEVGGGLSDLKDVELTREKREDISVALGIPMTMLWSSEAGGLGGGGVTKEDTFRYLAYNIVPHFNFIASVFNEKLFRPLGYKIIGKPETLDAFQEDEVSRSQAVATYSSAIAANAEATDFAMALLGVELNDKQRVKLDALIEAKQAARESMSQLQQPGQGITDVTPQPKQLESPEQKAFREDLQRWQRKVENRLRANKSALCGFESDLIDADTHARITDGLTAIKNIEAIKTLFDTEAQAHANRASPFTLKAIPLVDDKVRREAEEKLREKIAKILKTKQNQVIEQIQRGEYIDLVDFQNEVALTIENELTNHANAELARLGGVIGFDFDPTAYNEAARAWAKEYTYGLVKDLTENTRKVIQDTVEKFTAGEGLTKGELQDLLMPAFDPVRADKIAVTETTRAYSQAQSIYQDMLGEQGVDMERVWHTDQDDIVCPICRPLNNKPESEWSNRFPGGAPAHVNCRCFIGLRVKR